MVILFTTALESKLKKWFVADMENLIEPSAQPAVYGSTNQGQGLSSNQIRPLFAYGLYSVCASVFFMFN